MIKVKFPLRRTILLWAGYILLALVLTWPTVSHLTTHLPGDGGDDPAIAWNLWWVKYALLNTGQNPFQTDFLFFPIGINLAFYTLTVLNAVSALPLTLNLGVVAAGNLHVLFTFVAGAYGTYLLSLYILTADGRRQTAENNTSTGGQRSAVSGQMVFSAVIAGGIYAFAGSKLFYVALGQFNIASTHWIPFAVLFILKTHYRPHRLKNSLLAGLFITFQAWAEMTYASFLLVFLGLYWLYLILDFRFWILDYKSIRRAIAPHLRAAGVLLLTFIIGIAPILAQMLPDMRTEGDFLVEGGGFAGTFSADVLGFVIPTMHHPFFGYLIIQTHIAAPDSVTGFDKGQHIYLGFILLGLLVITLLTGYRNRTIRFWLITGGVFLLLSLGPVIAVNGYSTDIPGPFTLLQSLPFFKGNRYPSRYSVMLMLCLSVIAAFGLVQIGRWMSRFDAPARRRLSYLTLTLIAGVFLFEHLSLPLPQSNMQIPPAYQTIAADRDDFAVLDIPFAWRNGFRITGAYTPQFMFGQFYQTAHQKRLLQGNTSRNPEFKFQYFTNAPVINSLLALETGKTLSPEQWTADKTLAADALHFFDIKYIVVRPESNNPFGHYPQATLPYIEAVLPVEKIHDDPAIKIYRVKEKTANSELYINAEAPLAPLYFGEGWGLLSRGRPIVAQRAESRLLLPLSAGDQHLTLRLRLPDFAETGVRSIYIELNGRQSNPQQITKTWQDITFTLPGQAIVPGLNDVRLHVDGVTHLLPLQPGSSATDITVISAGEEVGKFGHIFVNGYDASLNQRGYNIVLLPPESTLQTFNFDTFLDLSASAELADLINTLPPNTTVAIAAADTVTNKAGDNLSGEAVQAIQSLGAAGDLRDCFRCSHAVISQPTNGTVIEDQNPFLPAGITTNLGLTEPNIAALVEWIKIEPAASQ